MATSFHVQRGRRTSGQKSKFAPLTIFTWPDRKLEHVKNPLLITSLQELVTLEILCLSEM